LQDFFSIQFYTYNLHVFKLKMKSLLPITAGPSLPLARYNGANSDYTSLPIEFINGQ